MFCRSYMVTGNVFLCNDQTLAVFNLIKVILSRNFKLQVSECLLRLSATTKLRLMAVLGAMCQKTKEL